MCNYKTYKQEPVLIPLGWGSNYLSWDMLEPCF